MSEYISIQEAIEKINERARETFTLAPGYEHYLGALHDVADDLRKMPTIDAVPVKHGKWIEEDDAIITGTCSVCGWNAIFAETDVSGMPYCPNCGARMDGERKDDE